MNHDLLDCGHPHDAGMPATVIDNGRAKVIQGWTFVLRDGKRICHACDSLRILSCGHHPSPHSCITTGAAVTADGREICCDCATRNDLERLANATRCSAYLASDGKTITNWPGHELMKIIGRSRAILGRASHTFDRNDYWTVRARDSHGHQWTGRGGPGIYIKLRRIGAAKAL
jgi:hypothetical protein